MFACTQRNHHWFLIGSIYELLLSICIYLSGDMVGKEKRRTSKSEEIQHWKINNWWILKQLDELDSL